MNLGDPEQLYRELIENLRDVIYSVDNHGKITYLSPPIKFISGYEPSELIGIDFLELVYKDDRDRLMREFARYVSGYAEPMVIESRMIIKSGKIRWTRILIKPLRDENGFRGIRGVLSDITENKEVEEALRGSEERYRAVWEYSPVGICLTDRDGIYRYVNPAYCRIYGYSEDELVGRPFYEVISMGPGGAKVRETHNRIFDAGIPILLGETEFIRNNGEQVWIEYTADFVRKEGIPIYLVSMNVDISDRKKAAIALKESEEKYSLLINRAQDSIFSVDENGKIILLNNTAARYLGGNSDDFVGRTILEVFPKKAADKRMELIAQVIRQKSIVVRDEDIELNGELRWFKSNLHPIFSYGTGKIVVQIISHDITEEKIKSRRNDSRVKLLEKIRNSKNIEQCLQFGSDTIYGSMLFKRSVMILLGRDSETLGHGQFGADSETVGGIESLIGSIGNISDMVDRASVKISKSYILSSIDPADLGNPVEDRRRHIRHNDRDLEWKPGDSYWTPMIGEGNKPLGWLCADSPFDNRLPSKEAVIYIEEITDIITQHIRELMGRIRLKEERKALENTNVTLKEVMTAVEEEKRDLRDRIIRDVDTVIMPILGKIISDDGSLNNSYFELLKKNLETLTSDSGGAGRGITKLTSREMEICELIKEGFTNKGIANSLTISIGTVKKHREAIRKKLGLRYKDINLATYLQNT
ncbi:MAG: PAS domain S-box protein [candidate division Zixibacteria bacterium]